MRVTIDHEHLDALLCRVIGMPDDERTVSAVAAVGAAVERGQRAAAQKWGVFIVPGDPGAKIPGIKAIRAFTYLGLKEAKDAIEAPGGFCALVHMDRLVATERSAAIRKEHPSACVEVRRIKE